MDGIPLSGQAPRLSGREFEVLGRVAAGASNKAIAQALGLSLHTVKRHVARTMYKLQAGSRSEAASMYRNYVPVALAPDAPADTFDELTPREREILEHVAVGASNDRIARELSLRVSTVKRHTANIREKLGAQPRARGCAAAHARGGARVNDTLPLAGYVALAALATAMATSPCEAAETPRQPVCDGAAHREFDFWVGEWQVFDRASGEPAGMSRIEKLYGGCVLRENWTSPGFAGGSLNAWWKGDGKWHQTWMDQAGAFRHFIGALEGNRMVLVAEQPGPVQGGRTILVRLAFTPNDDGTVRQYSDTSADGGATWRLRYDFLYRRIQ